MDEEQIRKLIREELYFMLKNDKFVFQLPIQIVDGKNVQLGKSVGTQFGTESTQKIGFLGKDPRVQYPHPGFPTGGSTVDFEARAGVSDALNILTEFGFLATP